MPLDLSMLDEFDAPSNQIGVVLDLPLDEIEEDTDQPRKTFTQESLEAMAGRIRRKGGVEIPIKVRPKRNGKYRIVDGARRYRSSLLAGMTTIRSIVEADESTIDAYTQVVMNLQREELRPVELARFIEQRKAAGDSLGKIADELGIGADAVTAHLALLTAPTKVQQLFEAGYIRSVHGAYDLCRLHDGNATVVDAFLSVHGEQEITRSMIRKLGETIRNPDPVSPTGKVDARQDVSPVVPVVMDEGRTAREPSVESLQVDMPHAGEGSERTDGAPVHAERHNPPGRGSDMSTSSGDHLSMQDATPPAIEVPFHNPDIESYTKPPKLDDPTRMKKPLLLASFEGDAVMVCLFRRPTSPGLAFVKYEDGRGEIEVDLNRLTNWTLMESTV